MLLAVLSNVKKKFGKMRHTETLGKDLRYYI